MIFGLFLTKGEKGSRGHKGIIVLKDYKIILHSLLSFIIVNLTTISQFNSITILLGNSRILFKNMIK